MNKDKSEGYWMGSLRASLGKPLNIAWPTKGIKILGVLCSYDRKECENENFYKKIKDIVINLWRMRNLTLQGRIQIIKTFIISKFQYQFANDSIPAQFVKRLEKIVYQFIWKSKQEKLKRNVLVQEIYNGGLKAPHLDSIIFTSRIAWVKRYIYTDERPWKQLWDWHLKQVSQNVKILLFGNFDNTIYKKLHITEFYREILQSIQVFRASFYREQNLMNQLIWINKHIKINGRSVFWKQFFEVGIVKIEDLFDDNKNIKAFEFWKNKGLHEKYFLSWYSLVTIILSKQNLLEKAVICNPFTFSFRLNEKNVDLRKATSKQVYMCIKNEKVSLFSNVPRINKYLNKEECNWAKVYGLTKEIFTDIRTQNFQYKLLHNILVNNYWLEKWKLLEHNKCTFCDTGIENILHLFWECELIKEF